MDNPQDALRQFAERASRYSFDLNGKVRKEDNYVALRGGYAIVYSGILQPDGSRVAIKTARGSLPGDESTIKRVLKEVHLWSKLRHENIVPVLGITTEFELTVSIVSPWMEKRDARKHVRDTSIDPRPLMIDIARGLQYLHTREEGAVFHGDLKGANVLISDGGQALLADFGFSHLVDSSFSMAVSGKDGFSIQWTAPEILLDEQEASANADIWSFGMTLLELLTRKDPFHGIKRNGVMCKMHRNEIPDRPRDEETFSRLTDGWWDICLRCWNFNPSLRPTIAHVLQVMTNLQ